MENSVRYTSWPAVEKGLQAVESVITDIAKAGEGGVDIEFVPETGQITVLGVATKERIAACFWEPHLGKKLLATKATLSAFSGISADKPLLDKSAATDSPLSMWSDSMVRWWICRPDLSSVPKSLHSEEGSDNAVAIGMMNLWYCTSYWHDVPQWKRHWAEECARTGRACPQCDVLAYCGVDAWAGYVADLSMLEEMKRLDIPESYYHFRAELTEYCWQMQQKGVSVDQAVVDGIEEALKAKSMALFPCSFSYEGKKRTQKVVEWIAVYENGTRTTVSKKSQAPSKLADGNKRLSWDKKVTLIEVEGKKLKVPRKVWEGPFNPRSPKAVTNWFASKGILLQKRGQPSMDKAVVLKAVDKYLKPYGLQFDPKSAEVVGGGEDTPELPEHIDYLVRLAQKSCLFKGTAPWFDPKYITMSKLHARFNSCATSMARLSSSKPNLTNVVRTGFGAMTRRSIKAEESCKVVKADYSSLELFMTLWWARSQRSGEKIFEWIVKEVNGAFDEVAVKKAVEPRDIAKSGFYGSQYGEGLTLLGASELSQSNRIAEIREGALLAFDGQNAPLWTFRGLYVCFTGANLADRLFGDRSRESRAKALKIQEAIFSKLPEIREVFHRETLREVENAGEIRLPSGHRLPLYGRTPEDDVKQALACKGQGGGSIYSQEFMLRFKRLRRVMNIHVHDEGVFTDIPQAWTNEECLTYMQPMVEESAILKGFWCPAKVSVGPNWKDTVEIGTIRRPQQ